MRQVWDVHYHDIIADSISSNMRQRNEHHWAFQLDLPATLELPSSIHNNAEHQSFKTPENTTTKFNRFRCISVPSQRVPVCGQHAQPQPLNSAWLCQKLSPYLQDGPKHREESNALRRNQQFCLQRSDLPFLKLQENSSLKKRLAGFPSLLGWAH